MLLTMTCPEPFEEFTRKVSSATASAADEVALFSDVSSPRTQRLKKTLLEAIDKCFSTMEDESLHTLSTLLDPRYKDSLATEAISEALIQPVMATEAIPEQPVLTVSALEEAVPEHASAAQEGAPESVPEHASAAQEGAPESVSEHVSAVQEGAPESVPEHASAAQEGAPESSPMCVAEALEGISADSSPVLVPDVLEDVSKSVSETVSQRLILPANAVMAPEFIPKSFPDKEFIPKAVSDTQAIFKPRPLAQAHLPRNTNNLVCSCPPLPSILSFLATDSSAWQQGP
ncbi:hypothetical protein DPX16_12235 [Anabarilius grahami]|uniref:Uncharacterized protein n=1 Tax=Anabarilius grahami TaxID=495550 RepID=A0A3N0XFF3_ANAGA|nr:hypothetical protein DPX16_12235 [Anabarilius grahami]